MTDTEIDGLAVGVARKCCQKIQLQSDAITDMDQEARIAAWQALPHYKPSYGVTLPCYLTIAIRREVQYRIAVEIRRGLTRVGDRRKGKERTNPPRHEAIGARQFVSQNESVLHWPARRWREVLAPLTRRERLIVLLHYCRGWQLVQIAKRLGNSKQAVSRSLRSALSRLAKTQPQLCDELS